MRAAREPYPPIEPFRTGRIQVDAIHEIYWEECGNPHGVPVVYLHGGPGAGCSPESRRFFDPDHYRIVLFDQRGAGRSTPHGEVTNNTPALLVADIETLRIQLGISSWHVFGGSWGSTLALAYSQEHPERCISLTLRGVFLLREVEIDWFVYGVRHFAPDAWQAFADFLPGHLRGDLLEGYWMMLNDPSAQLRLEAALAWARYEGSCATLLPSAQMMAEAGDPHVAVGLARIEVHYMRTNRFSPDDLLLRQLARIQHIPCAIVQGRYDLLCPPVTAATLHSMLPGSTLYIVEGAGHSASEPSIRSALISIMDQRREPPHTADR
jgi:proline iminopeptidase